MKQDFGSLRIVAGNAGLTEITGHVADWMRGLKIEDGLLTIFIRHTGASLLIQENAAPGARRDLERFFALIAPESGSYEHDEEGPDDMPAHLRAALTQTHLSIPLRGGRLCLGTWQGITCSSIGGGHRRGS